MGSSSFMNGKPASSAGPFRHGSNAAYTGTLTNPLGLSISSIYNMPLLSVITAPRPFTLNNGSSEPPEWSRPAYSDLRTTLPIPAIGATSRTYYTSSYSPASYYASSVVKMVKDLDTAYLVVSGLGLQADFGTVQMGKYVVASMMRTFLDGGMYAGQDKISQIPRIDISKPTVSDTFNNPVTVDIAWGNSWTRWDSEKYTEEYPVGYSETTPLVYAMKYSYDNGKHWFNMTDNSSCSAGEKDYPLHTTPLTDYTWNVSSLARGTYIIRIECYRRDIDLHYAFDQMGIYINR
jgi:hypothetical protein